MRRRAFLTLAGGTILGGGAATLLVGDKPPTKSQAKQKVDAPPKEIDITKQAQQYNSAKYASPPTKFRPGHVTPRKLPKGALKKEKNGFVIQLPSKAPIPTPAVYQDKVYVSGGFHSKEFYCINAISGELEWGFNLDDDGPSSAAVEDGVVVYNTESCTIFAHDAETGKLLWSFWLGDPLMSAPTIAGGRVFTSYPAAARMSADQKAKQKVEQKVEQQAAKKDRQAGGKKAPPQSHVLACLDLKTGKILWQRWIDADVISAPVAVGNELFVATHRGTLYKLTQADGKILSAKQSQATSSPTVVGEDIFYTKRTEKEDGTRLEGIATQDRRLSALKGLVQTRTALNIDPKVQKAADLAGKAAQLDQGNGFGGAFGGEVDLAAAARNLGQGNVSSLQAYQGARILSCPNSNIACLGGHALVCTNPRTGEKRWEIKLEGDLRKEGGSLAAPPVAAGGQIFLSTLKGDVLRLDPKTGKLNERYRIGSATRFQPAVVDGRIYIGTQDGKLVCIDTGNRKYTGWSMWGANAARTGTVEKDAKM